MFGPLDPRVVGVLLAGDAVILTAMGVVGQAICAQVVGSLDGWHAPGAKNWAEIDLVLKRRFREYRKSLVGTLISGLVCNQARLLSDV